MPNWCDNTITITGPFTEYYNFVQQLRESDSGLFQTFVPKPEDLKGAYGEWEYAKWGTKWDVEREEFMHQVDKQFDERFDTIACWYDNLDMGNPKENEEFWDEAERLQAQSTLYISTAWCPPDEFFEELTKLFPKLHFSCAYNEPACDIQGIDVYYGGKTISKVSWPERTTGDIRLEKDYKDASYKAAKSGEEIIKYLLENMLKLKAEVENGKIDLEVKV